MSILGKYEKQPQEIDVYSIQFVDDLADTDEIMTAFSMTAPKSFSPWDGTTKTAPYTALVTDDSRQIVATASVTLPVAASDGFRMSVANSSQNAGILVGSFNVAARGSVLVKKVSGAWTEELKTDSVLINMVGDQRVRTFVTGGTDKEQYKGQITVTTAEGRRLQDEFILKIKEV